MRATLGHRLFFDSRFSGAGAVSCATCHQPERFFTDGRPLGVGAGVIPRHTMSLIGASHQDWFTWDGKADSQWAQALIPLENPAEHGGDRLQFAHLIAEHYRSEYEALFGPLPDLTDTARFPAHGAPGGEPQVQAAWDGMAPADHDAVNRVFANIGKALAAYQRLLQPGPAQFDRYVDALSARDAHPEALLSADEIAGLPCSSARRIASTATTARCSQMANSTTRPFPACRGCRWTGGVPLGSSGWWPIRSTVWGCTATQRPNSAANCVSW